MASLEKTFTKKCYASQHLHPREYGVWEVLMRLTHGGKRTLYFDGRAIAAKFAGVSKTAVYRAVTKLEREGWLIPVTPKGKRNPSTQRYEATCYRVMTHGEWTATHGADGCGEVEPTAELQPEPEPVPNQGPENLGASPESGTGAGPQNGTGTGVSRSLFCNEPVPNSGHSFVEPLCISQNLSVEPLGVFKSPAQDSLLKNQGQEGKCESTPSCAASPELGTGLHTVQDSLSKPEPTLLELHSQLTKANQKIWYQRTGGENTPESRRIAEQLLAEQFMRDANPNRAA